MPEKLSKVTHKVDTAEIFRLSDAGHSQRDIERQTGVSQSYISKLLKARRLHALPTNGDAETTAETVALAVRDTPQSSTLQPIVQPVVETIVPRLDDHESRIRALETLLATVQHHHELAAPTLQPTARLHSEPARPRSIQMETDLFDTLKAFCKAEHRQMKEVVDTALNEFFADYGWTIAEGDRDA